MNHFKNFEAFQPRKVDTRLQDLVKGEPFNTPEFQAWFIESDLRQMLVLLASKHGEKDLLKLVTLASDNLKYGHTVETLRFVKRCYEEAKKAKFVRDGMYAIVHFDKYFYSAFGPCDAAVQHWIDMLSSGSSIAKLSIEWDGSGDVTSVEPISLEELEEHVKKRLKDFLSTVEYLTPDKKQHVMDLIATMLKDDRR